MGMSKVVMLAAASAVLALVFQPSRASAGALDGLAGGAIGFALGAMMAAPRPGYAAPRTRRVVVYRNRPSRGAYAAAPVRRRAAPGGGAVINASSDPFASSASPRPIPVSGR